MVSVLRADGVLRATAQGAKPRKVADLLACSGCAACSALLKTSERNILAAYARRHADALVRGELFFPELFTYPEHPEHPEQTRIYAVFQRTAYPEHLPSLPGAL
jgi:hypothetical protein